MIASALMLPAHPKRTKCPMPSGGCGGSMPQSSPASGGYSGRTSLRGTLAASVAAGLPMDRILAAYPSLDGDQVERAALWAEANPARGRPRASEDRRFDATIVAERRIPRRRAAG